MASPGYAVDYNLHPVKQPTHETHDMGRTPSHSFVASQKLAKHFQMVVDGHFQIIKSTKKLYLCYYMVF